jgi:hypothetical protein
MQLTSAQVKRTLSQFEAEAIPANHPALPQLTALFGDHTFFLNRTGLNILEPAEEPEESAPTADVCACQVVNLANWNDANPPALEPHEPVTTDVIVRFEAMH